MLSPTLHLKAVALILLVLTPAAGLAQSRPSDLLHRLGAGRQVRLRTDDGRRLEGRVLRADSMPQRLWVSGPSDPIPVAIIDSLWVRSSSTKKGALIGSLALGVPVGIGAAAICGAVYEEAECNPLFVAGFTAAGALAGAGLGALIGSATPRWHLLHGRGGRLRASLQVFPQARATITVRCTVTL